ncbi:MAG TPA: hypothetical protein VIX59_03610 [Candidatus Binataceae bacterium]
MPPDDLIKVATALVRKARRSNVVVAAIDGAGGAGKSTLAAGIRHQLGELVSIVRGDDFYRPLHSDERAQLDAEYGYRNFFDWQRMRDEALVPLRAGTDTKYQPYDWLSGQLRGWIEVKRKPIIVVEGVYSTRPELRDLIDVAVFVDTPRETRLARMQARAQNETNWIERWMAAEDWYLEHVRPMETADFVVNGS